MRELSNLADFSIDSGLDIASNISIMASAEEYKKTLDAARAELEALVEQREEIERRISQLKQAIVALSPLGQDGERSAFGIDLTTLNIEIPAFGITDACREVLKSADQPLTPLEVKARLVQMNPEFAKQKNLMASVHTVLKRLVPNEARSFINNDGETVYRWRRHFRRKMGAIPTTPPELRGVGEAPMGPPTRDLDEPPGRKK